MRGVASSLIILVAVSSCTSAPSAENQANAVDPAIALALADPLMSDPQLDRRSNAGMLRPADQPNQALVPLGEPNTLRTGAAGTALARARAAIARLGIDRFAGCALDAPYGFGWADRLPDGLSLPETGRVSEAAGSDQGNCRLRVVSFASSDPPSATIAFYRRAAKAGGYRENQRSRGSATVIEATRSRDGAAFVVTIGAGVPDGSAVDLVSNRGR
jgi:hypothetical protein